MQSPLANSIKQFSENTGVRLESLGEITLQILASYDYFNWSILKKALGPKKALNLYLQVWNNLVQSGVKNYLKANKIKKIDIEKFEDIAKYIWSATFCSYKVVETTGKRHEGHITKCPYVEAMESVFGKKKAGAFFREVYPHVSNTEAKALVKATGSQGKFRAKMDEVICIGDNICHLVIEKK